MCANDVTLDVGDNSYPGRVNTPSEPSERGILVVPGAGHGPFGDVFLRFSRTAAVGGYTVARFEMWPFPGDLESKTGDDLAADLAAGVDFLESRGCSDITVVAKSFGGRVALQHLPAEVDRLVLWAPAIEFGSHEDAPSITADELGEIEIPVRILQGDEDDVVSIENARDIAEALPQGELVTLPGEDHSFRRDHQRIIEKTVAALPDSPAV